MATGTSQEIEEERRLLYVAMTRAHGGRQPGVELEGPAALGVDVQTRLKEGGVRR